MRIPLSIERNLENTYNYLSKRQYEFQLAWGVFGQISALFAFETFAMVFCDKFGITGIPAITLYLGVPVGAVIAVTWTGNAMIRTGYAHKYMKYGQDVNRDWARMLKSIEKIETYLEKHDRP